MTLLICGAVLLVAIAAFFVFQVLNFRSIFKRDNSTLATIIANNSTGAMAFRDDAAANEVLASLEAKKSVLSATLTSEDEAIFARFGAEEDRQSLSEFPPPAEARFVGKHLLLTQPVVHKGERKGSLYMRTVYHSRFM